MKLKTSRYKTVMKSKWAKIWKLDKTFSIPATITKAPWSTTPSTNWTSESSKRLAHLSLAAPHSKRDKHSLILTSFLRMMTTKFKPPNSNTIRKTDHIMQWRSLPSTETPMEGISGPCHLGRTRLMPFKRKQEKVLRVERAVAMAHRWQKRSSGWFQANLRMHRMRKTFKKLRNHKLSRANRYKWLSHQLFQPWVRRIKRYSVA